MSDARTQLLAVLMEAASQDYTRMKQAEELLKQWETEPSFFATLQDIFYDTTVEYNVRFLSGIYLKNGIDRFWRRTAKNPLNPEEKTMIRERLLQFMSEPSKQLAAQNTVIIARIARLDFPTQWPQLLTSLIQGIETPGTDTNAIIIHHRCLETMYEVLSELSTRVLASGRRQFAQLAPHTFQVIANVYLIYVNRIISQLVDLLNQPTGQRISSMELDAFEILAICIRCLRILMVSGIRDVHKFDETKTFLDLSYQHLQTFMESLSRLRSVLINNKPFKGALETVIDEYGSLYLHLQKAHPVSVVLCPKWMDIVSYYWNKVMEQGDHVANQFDKSDRNKPEVYQQFLLQGMQLVKGTIKNAGYDAETPGTDNLAITEEEKALALEARNIIRQRFVTDSFVNMCAETLITKYMLLTPSDLEQWEEDPEAWANSVDAENWEFELRPCAEATFINLLAQHRDQLTPILLNLLEQSNVQDFAGLLFLDAIYDAVGLGVHSLYGRLDFESFVANRLVSEITNKEASFKILRRRIAWVLGRWVTESISADCRTTIYEILLQLMVKEEDLVVRLSAAHSLKMAIDDWDFDISILLPYLGSAMEMMMTLVNEVEESDTVMKLIADLNTIIDRAGAHVTPYAPKIIDLLTPFWTRAQNEPLFQSALVVTFTKAAAVLVEQSNQLYPLLLPMVTYCVNRNNEAHVYLLEDALDLWWTLLQGATTSTPELMDLLPTAVELLDYDTENVKKVLWIIESYILLDPQGSAQKCALSLFTHLASYVVHSKAEVASNISHTIDLVFRSLPITVYGDALFQSGLLNNILDVFLQGQLYAYACMSYMGLFARLALQDATMVIQFIQTAGQPFNPSSPDILGDIIDKWMDKFDNIGHPRQRKLTCLAFTSLLKTNHPSLIQRLPGILSIWSDVGAEVKESDGESVLYSEADLEDDINQLEQSPEKERKSELLYKDPVYTTDLLILIQQTLAELGGRLVEKVDPLVLEHIHQLLQ
ncbi:armadillo-type protein [Halteromyces radiatus]|uniref:armadillo-type protein n=1 Tax=Halteromyces radiatus TaxID=101107 RepID=UPI00221EB5A8|nr:armadillo-type protein [Halteromyces radiatus]KAI8086750.1 armadillo-type protein [Halteromyces radiatus]